MTEKRAITLNGTGAIAQVKELQAKTPLLEKVRYFYGANAATNIPVLDEAGIRGLLGRGRRGGSFLHGSLNETGRGGA
jgi:hypothetical protein